ncbi:MAG: sigma-70 family RNA polymerase sigma factor [Akkermansiaceae bacterium]
MANPHPDHTSGNSQIEREFEDHWSTNLPKLRAYVMQHMSDRSEIEDILQEVSLVLWQKWPDFKQGTSFLAWAKAVAHFKVLKICHQNKRKPMGVSDELLDSLQPVVEVFDNHVDARIPHLRECLKLLDAEKLNIIRMRYEKKKEGKEIAEHLGVRPNYLYKKIGEIRRQLARCINQREAIAQTKKP